MVSLRLSALLLCLLPSVTFAAKHLVATHAAGAQAHPSMKELPPTPRQKDFSAPAVYGHVFYKDGSPVKDAEVTCLICPHTGLPNIARTDANAYFMLEHLPFGRVGISASKPSEGFPELMLPPYYDRRNPASPSSATVYLKKVVPPLEVTLHLGDPYATIDLTVRSQRTRQPVDPLSSEIALADDSHLRITAYQTLDGPVTAVLPPLPVVITLTAPGYAPWTSAKDAAVGPTLLLKPGTHLQRDIFLKPTEGVPASPDRRVLR